MSKTELEVCLEDVNIRNYVRHFANKLKRVYPNSIDTEDAEQELKTAIIRAYRYNYDQDVPLIYFAKQAVFSKYGRMIRYKGNATRLMNEQADRIAIESKCYILDKSFEIIDAEYTLDQIKSDLKARANENRKYEYAFKILDHLREGVPLKECCERLHISIQYGYKLLNKTIKPFGEKYHEKSIT